MDKNAILTRLRYILNINDAAMAEIFSKGGLSVSEAEVKNMLAGESEPEFRECQDSEMARFLDGLIIEKRGPSDKAKPAADVEHLSNNDILKKLRIAFNLREEDMFAVFAKADFEISKGELSSFFRKPGSRQYRHCGDQILRRFLKGLAVK